MTLIFPVTFVYVVTLPPQFPYEAKPSTAQIETNGSSPEEPFCFGGDPASPGATPRAAAVTKAPSQRARVGGRVPRGPPINPRVPQRWARVFMGPAALRPPSTGGPSGLSGFDPPLFPPRPPPDQH